MLAPGGEANTVDLALVPGQRVDGAGLQQVVYLDLGVVGPGHAVIAARVEGETVDWTFMSCVQLLQLPRPAMVR